MSEESADRRGYNEPEGGKLNTIDDLGLLATRLGILSSHASDTNDGQLHSPCECAEISDESMASVGTHR